MAGALVGMVARKLGTVLKERLSLAGDASQELENLSSEFKAIQAVLGDAECRQITEESVRQWLAKLKAVAYDMDDVLDKWITQALTQWTSSGGGDVGCSGNAIVKVMNSVSSHLGVGVQQACELWKNEGADGGKKARTFYSNVVSWDDVAQQVKEIKLRLDQIAKEKNYYGLKENYGSPQGGRSTMDAFETSSLVDQSKLIGREADKEAIIGRLIFSTSQEDGGIDVFSIIGVGGVGKTTLARSISQDGRVKQHFQKVLWVCVSDEFDVKRIMRAIIQDDRHHDTLPSELNPLQKKLLETLQGKLFLLILDDIWNEDEEKWEKLRLSLQTGARGSKILITSRSQKVADMMDATYVHELKGLSDEDSWSLFSSKAFAKRKVENQLLLEEIGKEISKKCSGVPLSLKVMGSAMQSKRTIEDWQHIKESEMWALPEAKKGILPALLMSYYNLPVQLKQCFAYCSVFPKDSYIEKDKLVKMWMAQGFMQLQGRREIEDIAEQYFDELVARSMFQDLEKTSTGSIRCKMHDLLHDLAQFITEDESRIFEIGKSEASLMKVRHVAMIDSSCCMSGFPPLFLSVAEKLRTLLIYESHRIDKVSACLFYRAKFLRVLNLGVNDMVIEQLPESIGELKHLRYLDLSGSHILELPESLCLLSNLETLNLNACRSHCKLPRGMSRMKSLRHLDIEGTDYYLKYLPKGLGKLTSLRTLSTFILGGSGGEEGCEFRELKHLNSLRGHLRIRNLGRVSIREEAEEAELWRKSHLRELYLGSPTHYELNLCHPRTGDRSKKTKFSGNVLDGLRPPHASLQVLEISNYDGLKLPTWLDDLPFSSLVELRLYNCRNCKELPELGTLPALKRLVIFFVGARRVTSEFYHGKNRCDGGSGASGRVAFPKLESLEFVDMVELEEWEWPIVMGTSSEAASSNKAEEMMMMPTPMPSLQRLCLFNCPKLKVLPHCLSELKAVTELRMQGLSTLTALPVGMMRQMKELKRLLIEDLRNLASWPDELGQLKELECLVISNMPKLMSFPTGLGELKKLKRLRIDGLTELRYLPDLEFGELEALKHLIISNCDALLSLPRGLQRLSNLRKLNVIGCRFLAERCKRDGGEDWTTIAHIPHTDISAEYYPLHVSFHF